MPISRRYAAANSAIHFGSSVKIASQKKTLRTRPRAFQKASSAMRCSTERRRTGFSPGYWRGKVLYSQKLQRNGQPRRETT